MRNVRASATHMGLPLPETPIPNSADGSALRAFRVSGVIAVVSLFAMLAWPWQGVVRVLGWVVSGVALSVCLRLAWGLRDGERGRSVFDAFWLRGSSYSDGGASSFDGDGGGGGDGGGD